MCSLESEQVGWYNKFKVMHKKYLQWCWTLNCIGCYHVQINSLTADLKSCWMESMANIGAAWGDHSHSNSIILVCLLPNSITSWALRFGDTFETLNFKLLFFSGCLFEYYFSTCKFCFSFCPWYGDAYQLLLTSYFTENVSELQKTISGGY